MAGNRTLNAGFSTLDAIARGVSLDGVYGSIRVDAFDDTCMLIIPEDEDVAGARVVGSTAVV